MPFAVRAGGHSLAGFSAIDDGLVIDLRGLRADRHRPRAPACARRRRPAVGASSTPPPRQHGLAVTGGRISDTGVAGLTLGSGSGWLERRHGLTADSLRRRDRRYRHRRGRPRERARARRPVLGAARRRRQLRDRHRVRVPAARGRADRPRRAAPVRATSAAARCCAPTATIMDAADDDLGGCAVMHLAPPAPFVPPDLVGRPVSGSWSPRSPTSTAARSSSRRFVRSGRSSTRSAPMPYTQLQRLIDEGSPAGLQGSSRRRSWTTLPDARDRRRALRHGPTASRRRSPRSCSSRSAAPTRASSPDATALAHRDAGWMYHALAQWVDPADTPRNRAWTADLVAAHGAPLAAGVPPEPRLVGPPGPRAVVLRRRDLRSARRDQGPLGPRATCSATTRTSGLPK